MKRKQMTKTGAVLLAAVMAVTSLDFGGVTVKAQEIAEMPVVLSGNTIEGGSSYLLSGEKEPAADPMPGNSVVKNWQWAGEPDALAIQQDEETGKWGLGLPGVSIDMQADADTILSMLPAAVTATIAADAAGNPEQTEQLALNWSCASYVRGADNNWPISGDYLFTAALPEGYELWADTAPIEVNVQLGEAGALSVVQNVPYIDANGASKVTEGDANVVESSEEAVTWTTGWYVVNSGVTFSQRVTVSGEVHLILCDGGSLSSETGGIAVNSGNSLTIYGQTNGTGQLKATGQPYNAAIGSDYNKDCGTVIINGGNIMANAAIINGDPAAIGGAVWGGAGTIIINGGNVTANGSGKGIGGGAGITTGSITITGGLVSTNGIGVGKNGASTATTISGGIVRVPSLSKLNQTNKDSWSGFIVEDDSKICHAYGSQTFEGTDLEIPSEYKLIIEKGKTTIVAGAGLTNFGQIQIEAGTILENAGNLMNNGEITNNGTFENTAAFTNNEQFINTNTSEFINTGTLTNTSAFTNEGTLTNNGNVTNNKTITNAGTINNTNTLINKDSINNVNIFNNTGRVDNQGLIKGNALSGNGEFSGKPVQPFDVSKGEILFDKKIYLRQNGADKQYSFDNSEWTTYSGILTLYGGFKNSQIEIQSGEHNIVFNGISVVGNGKNKVIDLKGGSVKLTIKGANTIQGYFHVPGGTSFEITEESTGRLYLEGDQIDYNAVIGAGWGEDTGTIKLLGGDISLVVKGCYDIAALGAGQGANRGNIEIKNCTLSISAVGNNNTHGKIDGSSVITENAIIATEDGIFVNGNNNIVPADLSSVGLASGSSAIVLDIGDGATPVSGQCVCGEFTLTHDWTIPDRARDTLTIIDGAILTIPRGVTLTIPEGKTLVNNGTICNLGTINGTVIDNGTTYTTPYSVTYDANDGTGTLLDGGVYCQRQTVPVQFNPQPTRSGYDFIG